MLKLDNSARTYLTIAGVAAVLIAAIAVRIISDRFHPARPAPVRSPEWVSLLSRGEMFMSSGRLDDARQAFEKAAQLAPKDAEPYNQLSRLEADAGRTEEALHALDKSIERNPNDAVVWCTAAELYGKLGDQQLPVKLYRRAIAVKPTHAPAWKGLGMRELAQNQPVEALRDLRQASELDPSDFDTEITLGQVALNAGDVVTAEPALRQALTLKPDNPKALLASARLALMTDITPATLTKAGEQIEAAMRLDPSPTAYLLRGRWNLLQRRYPAAIADLKEAIRANPNMSAAHTYLSQAYAAARQGGLARAESDKTVEIFRQSHAGSAGAPEGQ